MNKSEPKEVCLLLNLGGFETRMKENLEFAYSLGRTVYSLTGDGLMKVDNSLYLVPADVMSMTPAELLVWSSKLNEQLQAEGLKADDAVILAAGKNYRGTIPLGTVIGKGIRLGA